MKRITSSACTDGPALATRMVLLFMTASAGILGVTAINLYLVKKGTGGWPSGTLIQILAALVAIGLIGLCSYIVTISITRPLASILDFSRSISAGKPADRLAVTGTRETAALASALNAMAETLQGRLARISSVAGALAAIDDTLASASGRLLESAAQHESAVERTAAIADGIRESIRVSGDGVERLSSSTEKAATATRIITAGIKNVAVSADRLEKTLDGVDSSVSELAGTGKRIGSGIIDLLDASSETASAIARMDASIGLVKKNALDASSISERVKIDAATGKRAFEESIAGMRAIRDSSAITAEVVENLSLRAKDIGTILSVIDEVAEQTDLLALNATIIAAQAGEQGKGFAVVADEIRELAERTSSSTREIASVIRGVQDETRRAVDAINLAEASISEGEKLAQHSGTALEKIVNGVERASIQVDQIARATVEQAHDSQSIGEAMLRVAELIAQISTTAGEQAKTCERVAAAIGPIKLLAMQVGSSALEQDQSGSLVSDASREITEMIELLREAERSRLQGCATLARTLDDSRTAALGATRTARALEVTVSGLSQQVGLLKKELAGFAA